VGAPKCGTTAMDHYLAVHPDVFMARKEMHFFGADLRFGPQFYRRDHAAYLAEFNAANGHRRAGEASVWYLFSEQAAAGMKAYSPDARVSTSVSLVGEYRLGGVPWLATVGETNIPGVCTTMELTEETITRPARERSLVPAFVVGTENKVLRVGYRGY
jgi:hypothetical protein